MRALDRKLLRDLARLKGQMASIAAVVACGVASVIAMRSTLDSMGRSRDEYYASGRFPHVFASLKRAPASVSHRAGAIPGVVAVESRVVARALLQLPHSADAVTAYLISVPDVGTELLNALHIRSGRRPTAGGQTEALVNEHFAIANHLVLGDTVAVLVNGRMRTLHIVGFALSPEFIHHAVPGAGMFADSKHTAIVWLQRAALAPAYEMDGAFNDLSLLLAPGANEKVVIARLDALLAPYGGGQAYGRKDQLSNTIVSNEIEQLRVFGTAMPIIFLSVAAFLLHIVLSRLIATQREEIATLKAFGYTNGQIARHLLGYPAVAIVAGSIGGVLLGIWVGGKYTALYATFFRFPRFEHHTSASLIAVAVLVSTAAAVLGTLSGVRAAVALMPAEGMRPPAPASFRPLLLERLGLVGILPASVRMILRDLERRPFRTLASVIGVAAAAAILVVGTFAFDSARYMADLQFRTVDREDLTVGFASVRPARGGHELARIPGVARVELFRTTGVRIRHEHRSRRIAITGLERDGELRRIVDRARRVHDVPRDGLALTTELARILAVSPGDSVTLELLERGSEVRTVRVAAVIDELIGFGGYLELGALNSLMREPPSASGAYLRLDPGAEHSVVARLRNIPGVAGTTTQRAMVESFDAQIAASLRITVTIVVSLAITVAIGVIYNGIRISLSERARELASLRVLGFTRREVAALLFGEQVVIDALGTPLGLLLGLGLAYWMVTGFATETYRFPVVINASTYLFSTAVIVVAVLGATVAMRGRVYRLDLIGVLKTRE